MMKFQGATKKQKVAKGSGSVKGRAVRVGRMDSVRHRKIGRCGQFIGAGGPAVRAVRTDQLGAEDCSSVRSLGPAG